MLKVMEAALSFFDNVDFLLSNYLFDRTHSDIAFGATSATGAFGLILCAITDIRRRSDGYLDEALVAQE